ncbi:MAG: hypothetical protein H0W01_11745 [Pseudonocardiales bacterium]|nr:hypothetical protein [Pseudonocardiales bacterium]
MSGIAGLRRLRAEKPKEVVQEQCELCAKPLGPEHPHMVHTVERRIVCACIPCSMLFDNPGAAAKSMKRIPDRYLADPSFTLSDSQWDDLQIPVRMAFFFQNSIQDKVIACYPSPAGATESELPLDNWTSGVGAGRLAAMLEPDVEALLVSRGEHNTGPGECLLVPIDACYKLVALVRMHWKGFDGGSEAWSAIDSFFADVRERARELES